MSVTQNSKGVLSLRAADNFTTPFQQIFAAFRIFMAEISVLLFFSNLASKSRLLLIAIERLSSLITPLSLAGEACCHFAPPIKACCHFAPPIKACCHFAPPIKACCHFAPPIKACCHFAPPIKAGRGFTNRIQREFDSNVRIATFEYLPASKHPRQKTNFLKHSSAPLFLCLKPLPLLLAEMLRRAITSRCRPLFSPPCEAGRARVGIRQTESKGNFCLITVYNHKNIFRTQNQKGTEQTFSNDLPCASS
jgi:hypothetical protein